MAVANSVAQKKNNGKQGFGFVDNLQNIHRQLNPSIGRFLGVL